VSHSHDHHHARVRDRRALGIALALIASFMAFEVVMGLVAGSVALLADAGHMLTDAPRPPSRRRCRSSRRKRKCASARSTKRCSTTRCA
jgi:hypothetical protein